MRLSPYAEELFRLMLMNKTVSASKGYDIEDYNAEQLYLDLCEAQVEDAWDAGSFREDTYVTQPASFSVSTTASGVVCVLDSDLTFTPTRTFAPASWRIRNGDEAMFAGRLESSAQLKVGVPYEMLKQHFQLYMSRGSTDFAQWFYETFLVKSATTNIYDEVSYLALSPLTPTAPAVPSDEAIDVAEASLKWSYKEGTLTNDREVVFTNAPGWYDGLAQIILWRWIDGSLYQWFASTLDRPKVPWKGYTFIFRRNSLSLVMQ